MHCTITPNPTTFRHCVAVQAEAGESFCGTAQAIPGTNNIKKQNILVAQKFTSTSLSFSYSRRLETETFRVLTDHLLFLIRVCTFVFVPPQEA